MLINGVDYGSAIHIVNNIYIEKDEFQYIVKIDPGKTVKNGKRIYPHWKKVGFYTSLYNALQAVVETKIDRRLKGKVIELKEAMQIIKEEHASLKELIEKEIEFPTE